MIPPNNREHGQTIVILALALIGLLGFTGLAVDGGMAFNQRRLAQSAADAAALAGARAAGVSLGTAGVAYDDIVCSEYPTGSGECRCSPNVLNPLNGAVRADYSMGVAKTAAENGAINRASSNNFGIDLDVTDNNGVEAQLGCKLSVWGIDKFIDVTTTITRAVPTAFVQLFLPDGLANTVQSTARVRPRTPLYYGNAVVALKETCDNSPGNKGGITFGGSNSTVITGGGVASNACITRSGTAPISAPSFGYVTGSAPSPDTSPSAQQMDEPLPHFALDPTPDCSLVPVRSGPIEKRRGTKYEDDTDIYAPGRYTSLSLSGNWDETRGKGTNIQLNPGLYCFSGSVTISGGKITGSEVTLYLANGNFQTGGGANINLSAPFNNNNGALTNGGIVGLLIYVPENVVGAVKMTGNAGSTYTGLVYNASGTCDIAGTTNGMHEFSSQVVCGTVKITGDATINVNFNRYNAVIGNPLIEQNK
jgi:Flp pilus assembly protein TadG